MARIYTMFTSSGLMGECQIFSVYHPDREILSNEKIRAERKARCEGVEFVGGHGPKEVSHGSWRYEDIHGVRFVGCSAL